MGYWSQYPDREKPEALIEGSEFQQWQYQIDYALKREVGLDKFTSERAHLHKVGYPFKAKQQRASSAAADLIYSNVSRRLLLRISNYEEKEPWELWQVLENISQPFPFLRLPRELRDAIYELYLSSWEDRRSESERRYYWTWSRYNWPDIFYACRTTRDDAIPIFYSSHNFYRKLGYDVGPNYSRHSGQYCGQRYSWIRTGRDERLRGAEAPIHILLGDWTKALFRCENQRRHLRKFTVSFDVSRPPSLTRVYVQFEVYVKRAPQMLDVTTRVDFYGNRPDIVLRPHIQQRLEKHIENCNALAEEKDWRGEVIFHALDSDPEVWMLGIEHLEQLRPRVVEVR